MPLRHIPYSHPFPVPPLPTPEVRNSHVIENFSPDPSGEDITFHCVAAILLWSTFSSSELKLQGSWLIWHATKSFIFPESEQLFKATIEKQKKLASPKARVWTKHRFRIFRSCIGSASCNSWSRAEMASYCHGKMRRKVHWFVQSYCV